MQLLNCKYIILPAIKTEDQTKCLICINSTNYVFMNSTRSKEYILNQKSMKDAKITGLSFTRWLEHNFCCICLHFCFIVLKKWVVPLLICVLLSVLLDGIPLTCRIRRHWYSVTSPTKQNDPYHKVTGDSSLSVCVSLSLTLQYKWAFKVSAHMATACRGPLTLTVTWERFFERTSKKLDID